jgi:hypothetical protein
MSKYHRVYLSGPNDGNPWSLAALFDLPSHCANGRSLKERAREFDCPFPSPKRKPELVNVRLIPWEYGQGLWGIAQEFDDGVTYSEMWGSIVETRRAVQIRRQDIRKLFQLRRLQ